MIVCLFICSRLTIWPLTIHNWATHTRTHKRTVCFAGHNEKRLLHDLLDQYNTLERPVVNESDPLQISFGLTLMQIIDVDEKNQMLVTNIWLKLVSMLRDDRERECNSLQPPRMQICHSSVCCWILTLTRVIIRSILHQSQEWNDMNLRWYVSLKKCL